MQMQGMWICRAYLCFSLFRADPTKGKVGSGLAKHEEGRRRYGRKEFKAKGRRERNVRFERGAYIRPLFYRIINSRIFLIGFLHIVL